MIVPVPKVGPELKSASPSQIKEYRLCPSKWYLNKRCGIPQPEGHHLIVGTGLHAGMESYFETGTLFEPEAFVAKYFPKPDKVKPEIIAGMTTALKSGLQLLKDPDAPKFKPGLLVEVPKNYSTGLKIGGITLRQRSDLLDPTDPKVARSFDWKSSGRVFSDYSKTGEQLAKDEQGILYAKEAFEKFKPEAVIFTHGVVGTNEVEYDLISTDAMPKEYVDREFEALGETVQEMRKVFSIDDFAKVPRKPSNAWGSPCRAFKGCPYASAYCGVDLSSTSATPPPEEGSTTMTLKERLKAKQTATPAGGINPPDAAKPAPVTPYVPAGTQLAGAPNPTDPVAILRDLKALIAKYEGATS